MFTYCLFCETVKCDHVAESARMLFDCIALYPKTVQHTWSNGKMVDIERDLLPGYVFLYSNDRQLSVSAIRSIHGVIRCLTDPDRCCELSGGDEQFAMMLLRKNGVIGKTQVYREGQMIRICKGTYEGVETGILKVDKRNKRMLIEIPFADRNIKTWVEYEVAEHSGSPE